MSFCSTTVNKFQMFLKNLRLPDIETSVAGIKVILRDIVIQDFDVPRAQFEFGDDSVIGKLLHLKINFQFQFSVVQQIYPYIQDGGEGLLRMDTDLIIDGNPRILESCRHHLFINASRVQVQVQQLHVQMNGKYEFIYAALLVPLSNLLIQMMNEELQVQFSTSMMELINQQMSNTCYLTYTDGSWPSGAGGPYNCDQRWIAFNVTPEFLTAESANQMVKKDPANDQILRGWLWTTPKSRPSLVTNDHMQYQIQLEMFQSCLNAYLDTFFNLSFLNKRLENREDINILAVQFTKTGLMVSIKLGGKQICKLLFKISSEKYKANDFSTDTRFVLNFVKVLEGDRVVGEQIGGDIHAHRYNIAAAYTLSNCESEKCKIIYINADWMEVSCNFY